MKTLDADIQNLIRQPIDPEELAEMSRMFTGAINSLIKCLVEAKHEGRNINQGINERTRGRTQPSGAKYAPFRLCKAKRPGSNQDISNHREFDTGQTQRIYAND